MQNEHKAARIGAILLGAGVCMLGARTARAQNALGDGRVLDRNLQHGSGGVNTQVRDLNALIRFNNAVVTGNAPGGRSFRGDAGYLASDDFRAATGSDTLFNFRRDSSASALATVGIRGTDAVRYQFALSTGQAPPPLLGRFGDYSTGINRGGNPIHQPDVISSVEQRVSTGGTSASALRSTADYNSQQALLPSVLGVRQEKDGRESVLTASPLLGVNWSPLGEPGGQAPAGQGANPNPNFPGAPLTGLESVPSYVNNPVGVGQSMAPGQVDTRVEVPQVVTQALKRAIEENAKKGAGEGAAETPKPADVNTPLPGTAKPGDTTKPGESAVPVWERELDRIRKHLSGLPDEGENKPGAAAPGDTTNNGKGKEGEKPQGLQSLIEPATGKLNPDVLKALQGARPVITSYLPEQPKAPDTYSGHMARGEQLLKSAQYFDAEDSFVRALAVKPADPLANIGRIHAQLGASLFVGAASNLKTLFTEHPEMIGTRYAASLLPSQMRIQSLAEQLRLNIKDPTSAIGKESGMLLAYLGYQSNNAPLVKEGLDAMAAKTYPEQKSDVLLLGLMQKIWAEGHDLPPAPATPPAPAAEKPVVKPATPTPDQNK